MLQCDCGSEFYKLNYWILVLVALNNIEDWGHWVEGVLVFLPIILPVLEEVGVLVDPLDGRVQLSGKTPVPNVFGVIFGDRILPGGVELVVVGVLEEVDLSVSAPDEGGVEVGGDARKSVGNGFRISSLVSISK